jgi:hypothetical protein
MPLQLFDNVGQVGLVADISAQKIAPGAWSDGRNVRFNGFTASKVLGSRAVQGSLSTSAYSLFAHTTFDGSQFLCYAGLTSVYTTNQNLHYDLTRASTSGTTQAYSADATALWTGGVLGGLLFLNNGVDVPQIQLTPTASCRLSDLPNWPTTITTRCTVLRAYRNYLVALDVTKGTIRYRQMVKWSASADPLTAPSTWDEADTTADAGETSLSETNGSNIDCLPLRDVNIIYKDDAVYGMQFIGGAFIFRFYQIFSGVGLLAKRCVAAFENYHLFVGNDLDVYVHDGNSIRSVAQDRWREWLRENVDGANYERMFVVANPVSTEIWICVPTGEASYPTKALLWNWRKDTWGVRDLPVVSSGVVGVIESSDYVLTWDTITSNWDTINTTWGQLDSLPPDRKLVLASPDVMTGLIETEFGSTELQTVKFIRRIRFRTVDSGSTADITFKVAVQTDLNSTLTWQSTNKLTNNTAEITVLKRGRFVNVQVMTDEDTLVDVLSYEIEYEAAGSYL